MEKSARAQGIHRAVGELSLVSGIDGCHGVHKVAPELESGGQGIEAWRDLRWALRYREAPAESYAKLRAAVTDVSGIASSVLARRRSALSMLRVVVEPRPDPQSRVTLSERRDEFGVPLARIDWRLDPEGETVLDRFLRALAKARQDVGFRLLDVGYTSWPRLVQHGAHHMGATRMHRDPARGVVDADGKVHGVDNPYIAGSSTFPTFGTANPTLTIVALAIRLADHLANRLS